jgi:hypothetical protein
MAIEKREAQIQLSKTRTKRDFLNNHGLLVYSMIMLLLRPVTLYWWLCFPLLSLSSFWVVLLVPTTVVVNAAVVDPAIVDCLIEWVLSAEHGVWNRDKLEIRRPNDAAEYLGVFAKADIAKDELLMQIPRNRYIQIMDESLPMDYDDQRGFDNYYTNICRLAAKLQRELTAYRSSSSLSSVDNNNDNDFAPYLAYLAQQTPGQLPATWSKAGQERLRKILPTANHDVLDWIEMHYDFCTKDLGVDKNIIALTVQRCYDVALIPLWDMVNHDNGKVNVVTSSWHDPHGIQVWASRPITAGEEIYATYDKCTDCSDVAEYWGTTEVLRDFGFVEPYPQRWTWDDLQVWFEVHQRQSQENDDEDSRLTVIWDDHDGGGSSALFPNLNQQEDLVLYGPMKGVGLEFVKSELARLLELHLDDECHALPHECYFIQQYQQAILTALPLAIAAAERHALIIAANESCNANDGDDAHNPSCHS